MQMPEETSYEVIVAHSSRLRGVRAWSRLHSLRDGLWTAHMRRTKLSHTKLSEWNERKASNSSWRERITRNSVRLLMRGISIFSKVKEMNEFCA
jgi:hypothetical protein